MSSSSDHQGETSRPEAAPRLPGGERRRQSRVPVAVGAFFAALAIVLTFVGLWREDNLSFRNVVLGIVLGGGTWGLVGWAITSAVVQVEEEVSSRRHKDANHQ
jgi:hypothetical protein